MDWNSIALVLAGAATGLIPASFQRFLDRREARNEQRRQLLFELQETLIEINTEILRLNILIEKYAKDIRNEDSANKFIDTVARPVGRAELISRRINNRQLTLTLDNLMDILKKIIFGDTEEERDQAVKDSDILMNEVLGMTIDLSK